VTPSTIDGRACAVDEAVAAAAERLVRARLALLFGLLESTVEAVREAVRLAADLGGVVDTATTSGHAAAWTALERLGGLTTSLAEASRRADLVVFWACDGGPLAAARPGRARVAVDVGDAMGPADVDMRLRLRADEETPALSALRCLARGRRAARLDDARHGELRALVARVCASDYAAIVTDGDPAATRREPLREWALAALARDLRRRARVRVVALRASTSAERVLTWLTGFPGAVRFDPDGPRYGPAEWSGERLLARGMADAVVLIGADPSRRLGAAAQTGLARTPAVVLGQPPGPASGIWIAATAGEDGPGHSFDEDGVARRRRGTAGNGLGEAELLGRIRAAVSLRKGGRP
jgi:formylmethanofuran dehydrogenase subunit B